MTKLIFLIGILLLVVLVSAKSKKHRHGDDSSSQDDDDQQGPSSSHISKIARKKMAKLFKKIDADGDEIITRDELTQFFESMDGVGDVARRDGLITKEEFVSACREKTENRFANELVYGRFDRDNNGDLEDNDIFLFFKTYDKDGDSKISKTEYIDEVWRETSPLDEAIEELFVINDMNYNGFWDRLDQHALWNQYDVNKNGLITKREFERYWNVMHCRNFGPGAYWFKNFDVNGDGVIDEISDKENVIMNFDQDKDGRVTEEEMKIEIKKLMKNIPDSNWKCPKYCSA